MVHGSLIYCRSCDAPFIWVGDLPLVCEDCGTVDAGWTTEIPSAVRYAVTENDKKLLRARRIDPDE